MGRVYDHHSGIINIQCSTAYGHSGSPLINQQGKILIKINTLFINLGFVIGMLFGNYSDIEEQGKFSNDTYIFD